MTQQTDSYSHQLIAKMDDVSFNLFENFENHLAELQKTGGIIGVAKKSLHTNPVQTALELDKFGIQSQEIKAEILNQSFYNHLDLYLTSPRFGELSDFVITTMKKFVSKPKMILIVLDNIEHLNVLLTEPEIMEIVKNNALKKVDLASHYEQIVNKVLQNNI